MTPPENTSGLSVLIPYPRALSRRQCLARLCRMALKSGLVLGVGSLVDDLAWLSRGAPAARAGIFSRSSDHQWLANAPDARYWLSANADGADCTACHPKDSGVTGQKYIHDPSVVKCLLCAQECILKPGERGTCRARANDVGRLKSLVYGHPVAVQIDPIEKKPFYHFLPGVAALSMATAGCPLSCKFCQNWQISQARPEDFPTPYTPPDAIVQAARGRAAPVIAFTYNEPTVFAEYLLDIARTAREQNVRCVLVSCGFMNEAPLDDMCAVLDAVKIDLKGFDRGFYRKVCGAALDPVLRSIRQVARRGVHLEIVNLVVPTLNDSDAMLTELVKWISGELGPDVPVHFTRFHPDYQMLNLPPTPVATLERAYEIARKAGLRYPYVGNVPGHPGNHTHCPACGKVVIRRADIFVTDHHLKGGCCGYCGVPVAGVWS